MTEPICTFISTPTDDSPAAHWAAFMFNQYPTASWQDIHDALGGASVESVRVGAMAWCKRQDIHLRRRLPQRRVVREQVRGSDAPVVEVQQWRPCRGINHNHAFAL
jgi:hypothetical protein